MIAYSPPPWIEEYTDEGEVFVRMDKGHSVFIGNMEDTCQVCHANARLIAAAPDLLYVVENTLANLLAFKAAVVKADMIVPLWANDRIDDLKAAIIKAKP